jgi:hypothetical protein
MCIIENGCLRGRLFKVCSRVDEEEINQIIEDAIPKSTKRQTSWSIAISRGQ